MNSKHIITAIACVFSAAALAEAENTKDASAADNSQPSTLNPQPSTSSLRPDSGWSWSMGEGIVLNETPIVSAELTLAFDSKYLSYGLVDNNDPILTPAASLTLFDWVSIGVESIFDISHYGDAAGYGDRAWRYTEVDPSVSLAHGFGPDDVGWLPTTVEFEINYMYESHPPSVCWDTQFLNFSIGLPDLWIEPTFSYELDIERDNGTYLNLELGHIFTLIGPHDEEGDDILDFRLSVAQGWGDNKRIYAYLPDIHKIEEGEFSGLNHQGLMDTCFKGEFTWNVVDGVTLAAYIAYSDYLFDPSTREASRHYEATGVWDESWNFVTGVSLAVSF